MMNTGKVVLGKESVKNRIKLLMKKEYIKITHQRWSLIYFLEMIE